MHCGYMWDNIVSQASPIFLFLHRDQIQDLSMGLLAKYIPHLFFSDVFIPTWDIRTPQTIISPLRNSPV